MNCPICREEMELGCIQSRDALYWSEASGSFGRSAVLAYCCEKCKKVVVDYSR